MTRNLLWIMIILVFTLYGTANADFYKWEDENGNIHITDYPPPAKSGKKVKVHKYDSDSTTQSEDEQKVQNEPKVILYTKNSCIDCDKARDFLKAKKIPFTEYNTDTSKEAAKRRKEIDDSNEAPFAIINTNQVFGFSESIYNRALKLKP